MTSRNMVINRLVELIGDEMEINDINRIEISCYNKSLEDADRDNIYKCWSCIDFINIYCRVTLKIITHFDQLKDQSNIMNKIWNGDINIDRIAYLSHSELMPSRNKELIIALNERKSQKIVQKICTIYKCPKCGKRETTTHEVQLRALDEGANIKAKCAVCGHEWIAY